MGLLINAILFVVVAIAGGLGSAWYMIETGSRLTTESRGPWVTWTTAARPEADPYTRAHFMRRGQLPLSSTIAAQHQARVDDDGEPLHSACEYRVEITELDTQWWSLAVHDDRGRLIANPAERYGFSSATAVPEADGGVAIHVAREARPGNWLPTTGAGRLVLTLTLQDARAAATGPSVGQTRTPGDGTRGPALPAIRKVGCR